MPVRSLLRKTLLAVMLTSMATGAALAGVPEGDGEKRSNISISRGIGFIQVNVFHHRKIGQVVLEVRNAEGKTLYREEGKALTDELVRRLDKGIFPRGTHYITVTTRDISITEEVLID
jgi:hypothetical protein